MMKYYSGDCWPHNLIHEQSRNGAHGYYADYLSDPATQADKFLDIVDIALLSSRMEARPYTYRQLAVMRFKEQLSCRAIGDQFNKSAGHVSESIKAIQRVARFAMNLSVAANNGAVNLCDPLVVAVLMNGVHSRHKLATSTYTFLNTFLSHEQIAACVKCIEHDKSKVLRKSFEHLGATDPPLLSPQEKRITITIPREAIPGYYLDGEWIAVTAIK